MEEGILIPVFLFEKPYHKLNLKAKMIYGYLICHCDYEDSEGVYASIPIEEISKYLGFATSTIIKHIRKLKDFQLVKIKKTIGEPNKYYLDSDIVNAADKYISYIQG